MTTVTKFLLINVAKHGGYPWLSSEIEDFGDFGGSYAAITRESLVPHGARRLPLRSLSLSVLNNSFFW